MNDKSALVQVMAWCRQATSHYLSQSWQRSMSPYVAMKPQWVHHRLGQCLTFCWTPIHDLDMMASSNGNIFRVTGHLCGEFNGPWWIPRTKASDAELWCFLDLRLNKPLSKQSWRWWFETPSRLLWRQCNGALLINTLRPRQNGRRWHFQMHVWIPIAISLKFVPEDPVSNIPALVRIVAWRRPGDKLLSESMMASLLMCMPSD